MSNLTDDEPLLLKITIHLRLEQGRDIVEREVIERGGEEYEALGGERHERRDLIHDLDVVVHRVHRLLPLLIVYNNTLAHCIQRNSRLRN